MSEKFTKTRYIWEHRGGIAIGLLPGAIAGLILGYKAAQHPDQGTVYTCKVSQHGTIANCPDGILQFGNKTIKLGNQEARRDTHTGNGTLMTATDIFSVHGKGTAVHVFDSKLPVAQGTSTTKP